MEAALIAVDGCMTHVLRITHFLLAQGYKAAKTVIILQDNQSVNLLDHNNILSSSKSTNHLNVNILVKQQD